MSIPKTVIKIYSFKFDYGVGKKKYHITQLSARTVLLCSYKTNLGG